MKVFVFAQSRKPFIALLQQEGIDFQEPALPVGVPMASGTHIEIPLALAGIHQLVRVVIAYLKARQSRKIIITTKEGVFNFQAEGLNQSELERTLRLAHSLAVIETRDPDVQSGAGHSEVKD